jgi:H-type small acid-soluble spore protein
MRAERAVEIVGSMRYIDVAYQGVPVYIQSVDKTTGRAEVMPCDSDDSVKVAVDELEEMGQADPSL